MPFDADEKDVSFTDSDVVRAAIVCLKNTKATRADDLPAELFKFGDGLIFRTRSYESAPDVWNLSVGCPMHKKGHPTVCAN